MSHKIEKEHTYVQDNLILDQTFTNNSNSPIIMYASFDDLVNNLHQIAIPVHGVMTYKGSYNDQYAVYKFIYNEQELLISLGTLYSALRAQKK